MINVGIVGAGRGGSSLLEVFIANGEVNVVGITDRDPEAPGLKLAKAHGIYVAPSLDALARRAPHILINATGDPTLTENLRRDFPQPVEVIEGTSAWFLWELIRRQQEARHDLSVLYESSLMIAKAKSLEEALDKILLSATSLTDAPAGSIALIEGEYMVMAAHRGLSEEFFKERRWRPRQKGLSHYVLSQREPVAWEDILRDPLFEGTKIKREGIRALMACPLLLDGGVVGILYVDDFKPRKFTERHKNLIKLFSTYAANAIEKFRLIHELESSVAYLEAVLDSSQDLIATTDNQGRIVKFSKGGERILGYREDEVIGKRASEFYLNPEERDKILQMLKERGAVFNYETKLKRKDGGTVDISLTISQLRDRDGRIIGTVGVSKDITQEKRLRDELARKNRELQELNEILEQKVIERTKELEKKNAELRRANQIKARFISNMSHELRTPLTSIIGYSELLLDRTPGEINEAQERYITHIMQAGKHLLHLVNNILDLAKIEAGRLSLATETVNIGDLIQEVTFIMKPQADKKSIQIETDVAPDVSEFTADRVKLKQILFNLLSNAVKFTPEGGSVGIKAEYVLRPFTWMPPDRRFLKLTIWDTGIGIPEDKRESIFEEFEQVDTSRSTEGVGLGLAMTKRLVELHGGYIDLDSTPGEGSRFYVYLPVVHLGIEDTTTEVPLLHVKEPPVVLVVEDDIATAELLAVYLKEGGYRVEYAMDGVEAIRKAKERQPFAIVLDIMLPSVDGWEVLQTLKTDPETADIPVIIHSIIEDRELAFALGATDYLVKPAEKGTILKKLGELSLVRRKRHLPVNILLLSSDDRCRAQMEELAHTEGFVLHSPDSTDEALQISLTVRPHVAVVDLSMGEAGLSFMKMLRENPATRDVLVFGLTDRDLPVRERLKLTGLIERILLKEALTAEELLSHLRELEMLHPRRSGLIDEVTGVFNHRYFQLRLAQEAQRASRYRIPMVLSLIDIDHFGHYVEKKGIYYGNIVLRKVAEMLKRNLRGSDVISRFGNDSFSIIFTNTLLEPVKSISYRFLGMIRDYPFPHEEVQPKGRITASIGVVEFRGQNPEGLILEAERALRRAIEGGGDRVEIA